MILSLSIINTAMVLVLILAVSFFDLTLRRIPNFLTFPAIFWGLTSYMVIYGASGLWFSFSGLFVGLAVFFIPFAIGRMGAGDVKLLSAVGALQGWQFVLSAALLTAVAGGVMAIVYLIATGRLLRVLKKGVGFLLSPFFSFLYYRFPLQFLNRASIYFATHETEDEEQARMPYGVAIAAGVMLFIVMNQFPWGEQCLSALPW